MVNSTGVPYNTPSASASFCCAYEEKLAQAREAIIADNNIQTLRRFFDADLDEESIRPI